MLLALSAGTAFAQAQANGDAALSARVDLAVEAQQKAQKIPGISLAVCRDGKIMKAAGYGLANVERNVPMTPETVLQTGSVGKQFTSMAVVMLFEEGKMGLDDKIAKYIPESPSAWNDVTVRELLTHTSGIPNYGSAEAMNKGVIDLRKDWDWDYYGDFLQARIFRPLGMASTQIISEADIVPHRSSGYRLVKGQLKNQEWVSPSLNTTADGALYTNVLDLAKWDAALYTTRLIRQSSFDLMWSPVKLNDGKTYPYGFGWGLASRGGHKVVIHDGAWQVSR